MAPSADGRPPRPATFHHVGRWVRQVIAVALALLWLLPLWVVIVTPMKRTDEYLRGSVWDLPRNPAILFENLSTAWQTSGLGSGFIASLVYGVTGAALAILIASLGAFGITRLRVRLPFFWFMLVFSGTLFPFQAYLIPLFRAYTDRGLYDTWTGMILFYAAICIPFCLFVLRGFFAGLSAEMQGAAQLDGASDFAIYWRIAMPLAGSQLAVLFLFEFTWIWNDLLFGLVLSASDGVRPIMPALAGMQGLYARSQPPVVLAAGLIASAPTVLLFLMLQRYVMRGMQLTAAGE